MRYLECGFVAEHQAAVGGQALTASPRWIVNSEAAEKFRGPARADGEVQDEVVGAGGEKLTGDGEVEQKFKLSFAVVQ